MDEVPVHVLVAAAGFVAGIVFGATVQRTNFCTMGALSDIVFMGSYSRFRAWLLAIAIAILVSQAMDYAGIVDLDQSIYLTTNFGWLGAIVGGLLFGFGMTLAGGCGNRILVRAGGGNLKSIVAVLFLGIFAYMTLRGLVGVARVEMEQAANIDLSRYGHATQAVHDVLATSLGLGGEAIRWLVTAVVAFGLLWYCFKDREFRSSPRDIAAGVVIGLLIPAGWWITGVLGNDDFDPTPLGSFTFVAPTGDSIQYLMTFTGAAINFGIATVFGVIFGGFVAAVAFREFRLETFTDANDVLRHIFGGAIMGIGGVMALGCTIGQGVTGLSTLALGSFVAWFSIMAGGFLGLKYLEEGSLPGAVKALLTRS
ncbi:YeeE/YedE family protein [Microbaculum marinum]|uniref:YeeE/YedE family protein n=1 Tax=Microbaculum marinum TaxID=1764581 RepID=A0AAW9RMA9_9HYPH